MDGIKTERNRKKSIVRHRVRCNKCGATQSRLPVFVTRLRRFADKALRDMVDAKLWLYSGYRKVARWARIGGCSHTMLMREIRKLGSICREALRNILLPFSGIICVDEVYFRRVKGVFCCGMNAVDARTGRVIYTEAYYVNTVKAKEKFGELRGENITATKTEAIRTELLNVFQAPTLKEAESRLDKVLACKKDYLGKRLETLFDMLDKNREKLFPYLKDGINRTNNPVEHYHGFVKRFQNAGWDHRMDMWTHIDHPKCVRGL
jgi:transposase-like protein